MRGGEAVSANQLVGKTGIVTLQGDIEPGRIGEVRIDGEIYYAYSFNPGITIPANTRVTVEEYFPPRTVYVSPLQ